MNLDDFVPFGFAAVAACVLVALAVALGLLMLGIPSASTLAALRRPHGARRG